MNNPKIDVIAIDGPAGSGKSTTARLVAEKLGFRYLDTGAMYRAVTLKALQQGIRIENQSAVVALSRNTEIQFKIQNRSLRVLLDGEDVTRRIRDQTVSRHVSTVAAYQGVRKWITELQRQIGKEGRIVAEGRDIGTVVFPDARLKIFLVASLEQRARRRQKDLADAGESISLKKLTAELKYRDEYDRSRSFAPLKKSADAIELDTTGLTIEQQVDFIVSLWKDKIKKIKSIDK